MRDRKVATRYAAALLDAARAADQVEAVADSYRAVASAVRDTQKLRTFLESPQVATAEKRDLVRSVLQDQVELLFLNFVLLLIDKDRIDFLGDIGEEYALLVEKERGFRRAIVTTAVPLAPDLEQALAARLEGLTGSKIILQKKVNPAVIGGACVVMGDEIVDGTVRTGLDRLRKRLAEAPLR